MKRFSPADPAKFKPLLLPTVAPVRNTRAMLQDQHRLMGLPVPDRLACALSGLLVFVLVL